MCYICDRNKQPMLELLKPFLRPEVMAVLDTSKEFGLLTLMLPDRELTLTADGDEGGYFHWKGTDDKKVPDQPAIPQSHQPGAEVVLPEPVILEHTGWFSSSKTGSLSPNLTKKQITAMLGFKSDGPSGDGKVKDEWRFTVGQSGLPLVRRRRWPRSLGQTTMPGCEHTAVWCSTPPPGYSDSQRKDYHAGYSDGWHRYKFGAACAETPSPAYRAGYSAARAAVAA